MSRYDSVVLKPAEAVASFDEWRGIWVIAELHNGKIRDVTFELLGAGRPMADKLNVKLTAVVLGHELGDIPQQLAEGGADEVLIVDHPTLKTPLARPSADVLTEMINDHKPEVILIGATHTGRDISSRIAVTVEAGMTADCTELDVEAGSRELLARRPAFGGKMLATIRCDRHRPQMATARPGIFIPSPKTAGAAQFITVEPKVLEGASYAAEVVDYIIEEGVDITKAEVLVAGGMGVGQDWSKLYELAEALGGDVACTRPVADAGLQERSRQIGQTGLSARPKLYIAVGISGAIQHIEGMKESGTVIAINSDPNAQMFQYADIGIVADWKGAVDQLIAEAKSRNLKDRKFIVPVQDTLGDDRAAAHARAVKAGVAVEAPAPKAAPAQAPAAPEAQPAEAPADAAPAAETPAPVEEAPVAEAAPEPEGFTGDMGDADAVREYVKANVKEEVKAWVVAADCIVCNGCEAACPTGAVEVGDIAQVDRDLCIADGGCFDACPTGAIQPGIEDEGTSAGWPEGSRLAGKFGQ
ncbi:MAG: FAD-binding protein [Thermoplasmatota archaeon]